MLFHPKEYFSMFAFPSLFSTILIFVLLLPGLSKRITDGLTGRRIILDVRATGENPFRIVFVIYDYNLRVWTRNNATPTYYSPGVGFRCAR